MTGVRFNVISGELEGVLPVLRSWLLGGRRTLPKRSPNGESGAKNGLAVGVTGIGPEVVRLAALVSVQDMRDDFESTSLPSGVGLCEFSNQQERCSIAREIVLTSSNGVSEGR